MNKYKAAIIKTVKSLCKFCSITYFNLCENKNIKITKKIDVVSTQYPTQVEEEHY